MKSTRVITIEGRTRKMIETMKWIRKPQNVSVENGKVHVTT